MLVRLLKQRLADSGALPPSGRALQGFGSSAFATGQSLAQRMLDNMLAGLTDEQKCVYALKNAVARRTGMGSTSVQNVQNDSNLYLSYVSCLDPARAATC